MTKREVSRFHILIHFMRKTNLKSLSYSNESPIRNWVRKKNINFFWQNRTWNTLSYVERGHYRTSFGSLTCHVLNILTTGKTRFIFNHWWQPEGRLSRGRCIYSGIYWLSKTAAAHPLQYLARPGGVGLVKKLITVREFVAPYLKLLQALANISRILSLGLSSLSVAGVMTSGVD